MKNMAFGAKPSGKKGYQRGAGVRETAQKGFKNKRKKKPLCSKPDRRKNEIREAKAVERNTSGPEEWY